MEIYEINPFVRYCKRIPRPRTSPKSNAEFVRTYDSRLFFILSGEGDFTVADKRYHVTENSMLYIPSGMRYQLSYDIEAPIISIIVNFDFDQSRRDLAKDMKPEFPENFDEEKWVRVPQNFAFSEPIFMERFPVLLPLLTDMEKEAASGNAYSKEYASALLRAVLIEILRGKDLETGTEESLSRQIKNYLNRHYDEDLSAETLGQQFGYHPYHLNRVFKKHVGITLHRYLTDQRIRAAKTMLHSTELTIEEIASAVGISGQTYFSYCFKKSTGISPSEYRQKKGIRYL